MYGWMDDSAAGALVWRDAIHSVRDSYGALWVFSSRWVYISYALVIAVRCGIEWIHMIMSTKVSETTKNVCPLKECPI